MRSCNLKLLSIFSFLFMLINQLNAQQIQNAVTMEIDKDASYQKGTLVSLVVVVKNATPEKINGKIYFTLPKGYRNLATQGLEIAMLPDETRYIPVKFIIEDEAAAGTSVITCKLIDLSGKLLAEQSTNQVIAVNNTLVITPLETSIYRSSNNEPLKIKVKVSNKGNIRQNITLVCKFPDPTNGNLFLEQNADIAVKKDSIFTFTYLPSKELARQSNYSIRISGFRNPSREIFGNTTVDVQNIASVQQYQGDLFINFLEETQNQITSSYRRFGSGLDFYQVKGSGGVNIPSGYLFMRGNIALSNTLEIPLVTNTTLTYRQEQNEYTIGNINKLLEMTLVGRGAEYSHTFEKNQKVEVGFVDQNYNLIEENSWLKNGYGFYAKGMLHSNNSSRNASAGYLYRYDPFEKAKHNILGTEVNYDFNTDWKLNAKVNGAMSIYEIQDFVKPSFAGETNYSGKIKSFNINGNYYYSSDYYPGNRRGSMLLQQNITTNIKKHNLYANVILSDFSPKFYSFETQQKSANNRIEIGNRFPKFRDFSFNLGYQYQEESSNSYNQLFGNLDKNANQKMYANRIVEQLSWISNSSRQSAVLALETGIVKYPMQTDNQFQMKINANYSYRNFNINSTFQSGSYYLSEYAFSTIAGSGVNYEKLTMSLFYNNNFVNDKVNLSTGVSYIKDIVYGKSPSAFINAKYNGKAFSTFFNSSWYNYSVGSLSNNTLTFEVGVTVNLQKIILNPDQKGTIKALLYYDTNNNNQYDAGEKFAANYMININKVALQTNKDGMATYKRVPYGTYYLKQFTQDGWYYDDATFEVDRHTHNLSIPLHQSGKMQGQVSFNYNTNTVVEFQHRASGISFSIMKDNKLVKKVYTDDDGKYISFLPIGNYVISIDEKSLPANTFCETINYDITLKAGEIVVVPEFIIKVKEKKINTKKFSN